MLLLIRPLIFVSRRLLLLLFWDAGRLSCLWRCVPPSPIPLRALDTPVGTRFQGLTNPDSLRTDHSRSSSAMLRRSNSIAARLQS
ncbi:hypothetical protein FB45DRAFT_927098 [Roridomyces roridus]|uniref:Secreted protein n=1 Tax=Roridomyces roridus TaxID=1738132 RepID=A0AAD7BIR1_9AGAR|nr:hypothetical protein FB45DRAFT_927098 [Roridomyces roridus]